MWSSFRPCRGKEGRACRELVGYTICLSRRLLLVSERGVDFQQ